jgi:hypothetical protein
VQFWVSALCVNGIIRAEDAEIAEDCLPRRPVLDTGLGLFALKHTDKALPRIKCGATGLDLGGLRM